MKQVTPATVVHRHPEAAYRVIEGAALIVFPREARLVTLNEVGTYIWDHLDDRTIDEVARAVVEEFDVEPEQALGDTISFIEMLRERGFVVDQESGEG